jgi:hypothetical protein
MASLYSYRPDAEVDGYWVEIKHGLRATRALREALVTLAYAISDAPEKQALLVLSEPLISPARLHEEWRLVRSVFRPEVMARLFLVVVREGHYAGVPNMGPQARTVLEGVVQAEAARTTGRLARKDSYYVIFGLLVLRWLQGSEPMTTDWISQTAGYSYPTVAASLERLGPLLRRHSDRRVELRAFPRDEWARLVAVSEGVRSTTSFADRSGQPRTPDSLLRRLEHLKRPDIAVGGVHGARHYYPELDLTAGPRLDLSVHCHQGFVDLGFVQGLDPALAPVRDASEPARVVVHVLRRKEPFFDSGADDTLYADMVECLLDLHEARLEPQALEFLDELISRQEEKKS